MEAKQEEEKTGEDERADQEGRDLTADDLVEPLQRPGTVRREGQKGA